MEKTMPVKARHPKARRTALSWEQRMDLVLGPDERWPAFEDDADRRAWWSIHGETITARLNPGHRPSAWWTYDSAEERDPTVTEAQQLWRMGELSAAEVGELMPFWTEWAEKARRLQYVKDGCVVPPGPEAEALWRSWAGVPPGLCTEREAHGPDCRCASC
jgi:hypothetical protein